MLCKNVKKPLKLNHLVTSWRGLGTLEVKRRGSCCMKFKYWTLNLSGSNGARDMKWFKSESFEGDAQGSSETWWYTNIGNQAIAVSIRAVVNSFDDKQARERFGETLIMSTWRTLDKIPTDQCAPFLSSWIRLSTQLSLGAYYDR